MGMHIIQYNNGNNNNLFFLSFIVYCIKQNLDINYHKKIHV